MSSVKKYPVLPKIPSETGAGLFRAVVLVFPFRSVAGIHAPGLPDVDFRFGAGFQAFDVLAVGVDQQKTTKGVDPLTLGEMSVKTGKQHPATIEESDT